MNILKSLLKKIIPNPVIRFLTGFYYGWHGNFDTWEEAEKNCSGYNSQNILEKVKESTLKVKTGIAVYERDSVCFKEIEYSYPLLNGLMWIAAQNSGTLNVLDFGGSLGSTYYQNKFFLNSLPSVKWNIVEQPNFVNAGKSFFEDEILHFYYTIDECLACNDVKVIILSSVLQYLKSPYDLLDIIISKKIDFIIIDRTAFINKTDRITVQKVHPKIYRASYPCWFFNKKKFLNYMEQNNNLILSFCSPDNSNILSEFLGFIYRRKN